MKNVNNANSPTTNSTPVQKQNLDEEEDKDYEVIRVILQHDRNPELFDWFEQLSQANKKLYNSLLYVARQVFFYHSDAKARKEAEEKEQKAKAANSASQAAQGSGTQNKSQNPAKSKEEKPYVPRVWNEGQLEVFKNMDQIIQETGKPFSCFSQKSMENYMKRFLITSDTDMLPSQTRQQTRKRVVEDMNNWMKSIRAYRKDPKAFNNVSPKLPGYKKSDRTFFTFTNQQCHFKDKELCFPAKYKMKMSMQPSNFERLIRVEVHPWYDAFKICIVYEPIKNIPEEKPFNPAAIDLGVNCLATVVEKSSCLICNGRPLKSELQYYNKKMAHLHSEYDGLKTIHNDRLPRDKDGKILDPSQKLPGLTKQMIHDIQKRDNVIRNYVHQVSRKIVNWCVERNVTHIIIGHNKGWKDECLMKKPQKQNFRYVPFNTLIDMITYKAKREGIEVIITEESYTSLASCPDRDPMPVFGQPGASSIQFSGKRITRGNYRLKDGTVIHADINAAGNTLRKVYPNYQIPRETFDKVEGFVFDTRIPDSVKSVKKMESNLPKSSICSASRYCGSIVRDWGCSIGGNVIYPASARSAIWADLSSAKGVSWCA